jgi:flavin-dependent dehydrogenase
MPHDALQQYGATAEEQYERLCREEPILRTYLEDDTRLTPIMKYSNYQLNSSVWSGRNWALVGDAGGFIDPIFSSGLLLALQGARELSRALVGGWEHGARRYERTMQRKLRAWRGLIDAYYDGRIFSIFRLRAVYAENRLVAWIAGVVDRQLAVALSGAAPESMRRLWLVRVMLAWLGRSSLQSRYRIS